MRRNAKKFLAVTLAASMVMSGLSTNLLVAEATGTQGATIQLTDADVAELTGTTSVTRTSVHDPSIVKDGDSYYVFGSHMGVSKSTDLQNWSSVTSEVTTSTLFGKEVDGVVSPVSYEEAYLSNAYTGTVKTVINGVETEVDFGTDYNIAEWITPHTIAGNQWAPDVIYNDTMDKWCMYMSLNGPTWNSAIVLLTADSIEGPYVYQGPVVFSGFSTTDSSKSFKNTDLEIVLGEQDELPAKYQKIADGKWGEYWPHAIDPCVFYDEEGKLWLTYGSWSGGIYNLELDENTGLRDYTVTYESDYDEKGRSVTSDEYFGTKIAGGYYVSGEGAYIEHIEDYYYLFVSYGFFDPNTGYNMRVFRSENPDGPFVDGNGTSAIFDKYIMNYDATNTANNRGEKIMGNYQWSTMAKGETSQGHNSAFVDSDGKAYVVYHTKFDDGTYAHEVRVHQLYVNSEGWLVASPYEYSGETISETGYAVDEIVGTYEMITHEYQLDYSDLECMTPVVINLNADGTVTGAKTGTWSTVEGTSDAVLVLDGTTYYGKFTEEVIDGTTIETMGFTFASNSGLCVWGSKQLGDSLAVAQTVASGMLTAPIAAYQSFELSTEAQSDAVITWESSNPAVLAADGTITKPAEDTVVTLTGTVSKGNYYYTKDFPVTVYAQDNTTEPVVVAKFFTDEAKDLGTGLDASIKYANPFNSAVTAIDISGGVKIAFDVTSVRDMAFLGTIFSFMGDNGNNGRLYMTPGSYLGYNATGGYFDANMANYGLVTDYIGESAHVEVELTGSGFTVTVNDEVAYTQDIIGTDGGAGTVTNYKLLLNWLSNTANELYFGYGSWWNAVGYDESNVEISNVVLTALPVGEKVEAATSGSYSKDKVEITSADFITREDNPFYGVQAEEYRFNYTINFTEGTAKNGWDGIFSFYNSSTRGRVSFQTAPYVCFNDENGAGKKWLDINSPGVSGGSNMAPDAVSGEEYQVAIVINADGMTVTVNGEEVAVSVNGNADYENVISYIGECDQLTWGVGLATTSYWNTEICTVTDISFEAGPRIIKDATYTKDEVVLASNDALTVEENPFYGVQTDKLQFDYTINFTEGTPKGGWDGIFSFYNSTTGGRISFQTMPYVCFNTRENDDSWLDINNPNAGGTNFAASAETGKDYQVSIVITADGASATIDGEAITLAVTGGTKTFEDLIAYIGTCDQLTWGVGQAVTSFWWTELCTLTDIKFVAGEGVGDVVTPDEPETPDVTPKFEATVTENTYEISEVTFVSDASIARVDNPFKGLDIDKARFDYTINFADNAMKNGWDSIFSFYDSATTGKLCVQTAPFISFQPWNETWMDVNHPNTEGSVNYASTFEKGKDYQISIIMTDESIKMYVDGVEIDCVTSGGTEANNAALIDFLTTADQLTIGVGIAETSFWNTERCTLKDVKLAVGDAVDLTAPEAPSEDDEPEVETPVITTATYTKDKVELTSNDQITIEENPFKGFDGDKLRFDYTINFADGAVKNGWDSLFSFYNSATNGRVSIQSAPFVCYNDWADNWFDFNAPGAGGDNIAPTAEVGKDYNVSIIITDNDIKIYVDGVELATAMNGSGASYDNLIDLVGACDQLTWGVGIAQTASWNTELCTLTNIKLTAGDAVDLTAPEAPVAPEQPDEEESSEVDSSTDEESSEVDSSTDEESSEVDSSTDEESSEVDSSTDEESSEVDSSTDEESSEVDSSTDEESSEVDSSTDEESSEVDSSTDEESSEVDSSTDEESSEVDSSTDEESSEVESSEEESSEEDSSTEEESSEEESSKEEESTTPESKPSSKPVSTPSSSNKPVVAPIIPQKVVEIVEIIEEIIPLASSIEEAGYSFVDLVLSNKNANLTSKLLGKYFGVDMMLQAHLGNGVGFTIDANTLSAANVEMNISSELRKLDTFADGFNTFHVKPSKAARLGQEVGLHVNLGKEFEGKKAYIYAKNVLTGELEFKAAMTVNEIGNVGLFTSEMTDVVIMVEN